jgi:hypothetical protein
MKYLGADAFEKRYVAYEKHLELAGKYYAQKIPQSIKVAFARIFWETGRLALRCNQPKQAMRYFSMAHELAHAPFASAQWGYRLVCHLFGPAYAERVASLVRTVRIR